MVKTTRTATNRHKTTMTANPPNNRKKRTLIIIVLLPRAFGRYVCTNDTIKTVMDNTAAQFH